MLDIGGWEFLLIAILGIMIIGPKELPGAIRTVSMFVRRARELARDFQSGIEEVAREAELDKLTDDDIKEIAADGTGAGNLRDELQGAVDPDGTLAQAMDYETDWTDDDLIDYDAPEFADDNRISPPEQPNKADTAKSDTAKADTGDQNPEAAEGAGEDVDGELCRCRGHGEYSRRRTRRRNNPTLTRSRVREETGWGVMSEKIADGQEEPVPVDDGGEKKMPLLEHLVELRTRLIYSFLAFFLLFLVELLFRAGNI